MDKFSKRLKSLRLSMKLSQKQFGILGGVSDVTQGYYESDDPEKSKNPSMSYLLNLKENEVDIYYLLTGEKIANNLNQEESLLLETFRNSNPQNKKLLLELCGALSNSNETNDKKKDDQDPPSKISKQKIGDIKTSGGSIGDIMNDSVKYTYHNNFNTDIRTQYALDITWEEESEKIDNQEKTILNGVKLLVLIGLLFFIGEMLSISTNPTTGLGQLYEVFILIGIPLLFAYEINRQLSKKIKIYFANKRKRIKREIYLN